MAPPSRRPDYLLLFFAAVAAAASAPAAVVQLLVEGGQGVDLRVQGEVFFDQRCSELGSSLSFVLVLERCCQLSGQILLIAGFESPQAFVQFRPRQVGGV